MRILIMGAGVLGCNLAHNFWKAGKDVTLLARGDWGKHIRENGLIIRHRFFPGTVRDRIPVVNSCEEGGPYDVIFVCLRYTQLDSVLETLRVSSADNIIFIGNNVKAEAFADALPGRNVMFGFTSAAGHREADHVEAIDLKQITIGDLKGRSSGEAFIGDLFRRTRYSITYEPNMGDYLLSHAAFVVPAAFACYYTDGNLKKIRNDREFIYKIIDANAECYEAVESLGHQLLPKGEADFRSQKYRKMCFRFYRLMCATPLGKICASDHAMNAAEEMDALAAELEKMLRAAGLEGKNYFELRQYMERYLSRI